MKARSGMSPGSIFIDFEVTFEGLEVILEGLAALVRDVDF